MLNVVFIHEILELLQLFTYMIGRLSFGCTFHQFVKRLGILKVLLIEQIKVFTLADKVNIFCLWFQELCHIV